MTTYNIDMQQKQDTAANWTTNNPTLLAGELGFETDTGKAKRGDGSTAWNSLTYITQLGGGTFTVAAELSSNNLFGPLMRSSALGARATSANKLILHPFSLAFPNIFDNGYLQVTSAATVGSKGIVGVFAADHNTGVPTGTALVQSGEMDLTTTGGKSSPLGSAWKPLPGVLYYLALWTDTNATLQGIHQFSMIPRNCTPHDGRISRGWINTSLTYAATFPDVTGLTWGADNNNAIPTGFLQVQ